MTACTERIAAARRVTMTCRFAVISLALVLCDVAFVGAPSRHYEIKSPNDAISVRVDVGKNILWSALKGDQQMVEPSAISLQLGDGTIVGKDARVASGKIEKVATRLAAQLDRQQEQVLYEHYGHPGYWTSQAIRDAAELLQK